MIYTAGISLYITKRATRIGLQYFLLSLSLSLMILLHGIHHLFAFLQYPIIEQILEFGASISALALALGYACMWSRH